MSHNVIAVNKFWASTLATILLSCATGMAVSAKSLYDGLDNEKTERKLLAEQVKPLIEAKLETRIVAIEQKVNATAETTARIEGAQNKMTDKIDKILQRQGQR